MASDCAFDEIFNRVLYSEQEAAEKREALASLKNEIKKISSEIEEREAENSSLQMSNALQAKKLNENEAEVRHAQLKLQTLNAQFETLDEGGRKTKEDYRVACKTLEEFREDSCDQALKFMQSFRVGVGRLTQAENEAKRKLALLQREERHLTDYISELNERKIKRTKRDKRENEQVQELQRLKMMIDNCEEHVRTLERQICTAETKRGNLSRFSQTDRTYLKLKRELEILRENCSATDQSSNDKSRREHRGTVSRNRHGRTPGRQLTLHRFLK